MSSPKPISLIVSIPFLFSLLLLRSSSVVGTNRGESFVLVMGERISGHRHKLISLHSPFFVLSLISTLLTYQVMVSSSNKPKFSTFTQTVRRRNPTVKTLFVYRQVTHLLENCSLVARSYGFHGLDLCCKYPSTAPEMSDIGKLLREWRLAVVAEARSSGKPRLLLTAAVFYSYSYYWVLVHRVKAIVDSLDWVNLVASDFVTRVVQE